MLKFVQQVEEKAGATTKKQLFIYTEVLIDLSTTAAVAHICICPFFLNLLAFAYIII